MQIQNNEHFTAKELEMLKGSYPDIAKACDCTSIYVGEVLRGSRGKQSRKAQKIRSKARELIDFKKTWIKP